MYLLQKNPVQSILQQFSTKEPQCSRYSRKTVRRVSDPNGPRPILGTKMPFPRPILGRKEDNCSSDEDGIEEYIGKEFRSINRKMQRLKVEDDDTNKQGKRRNKN
ncbi:hypothetical protein ILUMI_09209 [Ignelater luminosus]|uniref:Uncharacterized protein n=1 Tax=Ignelater luminosus TaxID=2038154 RepID=A0A8K0D9P4_IGNLU|nr:hypothetical protein ILUMI_09209 [Ignelater luminosus]